jgi:hypothetical protein
VDQHVDGGGAPADLEAATAGVELAASYSLGLSYRRFGGGGVMFGMRPSAGVLRWKSGLGTYVTVPV